MFHRSTALPVTDENWKHPILVLPHSSFTHGNLHNSSIILLTAVPQIASRCNGVA
jgi:hypothetical protein